LPLIGVVTDFHAHSYWLHPDVDHYFVASQDTKTSMVARGISKEKIHVTGIPIHPDFAINTPRPKIRQSLGLLKNLPTILLMGGGHGLSPMDDILKELLKMTVPYQVIAVTGTNKKLSKKLFKKFSGAKHITLYNYRSDISRLMDASDILITKAGGLTSSEALAKGLPMVIVNPLPGQEEHNVRFLLKHHAAVLVNSMEEMGGMVQKLLSDPSKLETLSNNARQFGRPHASMDAAKLILEHVQRKVAQRITCMRNTEDAALPNVTLP
jgi:processive 1,2-diacylglycerol beta-glucosyltransferase